MKITIRTKINTKEFLLCLSRLQNRLVSMRLWVQSLASLSIAMSCGVCCRRGSDPALLWLWCRQVGYSSNSTSSLGFPCTAGVALKKQNKQTRRINMKFKVSFRDPHFNSFTIYPEVGLLDCMIVLFFCTPSVLQHN